MGWVVDSSFENATEGSRRCASRHRWRKSAIQIDLLRQPLDLHRAKPLVGDFRAVHRLIRRLGEADLAGLRQALDSAGEVDRGAEEVSLGQRNFTGRNADAKS